MYKYKNIRVMVRQSVFHPGLFFSTKMILSYLEGLNIQGKSFLEIGSGSGLISISAARKQAKVTAIEISRKALENTRENAVLNSVELDTILSDLFNQLPNRVFDLVVFNPPYYPKKIIKESDYAWYSGENHQYFEKLFSGLKNHIHSESVVIMSWSEDSDLKPVEKIADKYGFRLKTEARKWIWFETNFIYCIELKESR